MIYVYILQDNNNEFTKRQKEIDDFCNNWHNNQIDSNYIHITSKLNKDVEERINDLLSMLIHENDCYFQEVFCYFYYFTAKSSK